ncbi:MAG TPA: 50S ribosomal protein L3 N(5)-glutamine methyltransferase [Porticoccaceae bacterium]|nr:50S ribosomal protein L3 N(5)-glutamine methyltransferase [Porticoccaceae bacterium]
MEMEEDNVLDELHSVRDFVRWGASRFTEARLWFGHGTDNAWDEAVVLVCAALHLPLDTGARALDARLTGREKQVVLEYLERRVTERVPAPYLTGEAWFAGLRFVVDERVLVPRSPFAELIQGEFGPWLTRTPERILDLCTGSGCIGIASALTFPDAEVDLVDVSAAALEIAEVNIAAHRVERRVRTVESDLFEELDEAYDLIVCNPPYVDADDYAELPDEYRCEPELALAAGFDGLDVVRRVLRDAADWLNDEGVLFVEVGNSAVALEERFPDIGFTWVELERGGDGIFVFSREELLAIQDLLD